jgi:hypothetical protein
MAQSDSEDEGVDDLEFDRTTDAGDEDVEADDDLLDNIEADAGMDDVSDGDDVCQLSANSRPVFKCILFDG